MHNRGQRIFLYSQKQIEIKKISMEIKMRKKLAIIGGVTQPIIIGGVKTIKVDIKKG